ncbi:MAG: FAD:protein FMN transferase [Candidatus Cloacimonetes bacterium]|nr:FAD:protein FMN transferase [Candidatus Cloacimonadota bacterium]MDD4156987.1 FAD:protein FMN transferase [Candidatus Cloacimonadota bacterium]
MKRKEWINLTIIILLIAFSYYRYTNRTYNSVQTHILMDTQVEIYAESKTKNIASIIDQAFDLIRSYDNKFSYYNENSMLNKINNKETQTIDEDFFIMLNFAEKLYHNSNGLYDISIANLIDLWDFENEIIPSKLELEKVKQKIGFDKITFSQDSISLSNDVKLNLGSISKGFIIDKAIDFLKANNVTEAYINAGGDIRFFSSNNKKWNIGIQHPRDKNKVIASMKIPDMAVVTSGDYERYFIKDNIRYNHIINPKTGYPANESVSVTIFSDNATLADALSTTAFLMNPFDAIELIKGFPGTEAIIYFYDDNNEPISLKTHGTKKWNIIYNDLLE